MDQEDYNKGSTFRLLKILVLEKYGEEGYNKVLSQLPETVRATFEDKILSSSWYPFSSLIHIFQVIQKSFGRGDLSLLHDFGYEIGKRELSWWAKLFLKFGNPHFIISRADRVWKYLHTTGELSVTSLSDRTCTIEIRNFAQPDRYYCLATAGWMTAAMELSGAKEPEVVHTRCRDREDAVCEWQITWK